MGNIDRIWYNLGMMSHYLRSQGGTNVPTPPPLKTLPCPITVVIYVTPSPAINLHETLTTYSSVQVEVMKTDQELRGGATPYRTSTRGAPPPLVSTEFIVQDDGEYWQMENSGCRWPEYMGGWLGGWSHFRGPSHNNVIFLVCAGF